MTHKLVAGLYVSKLFETMVLQTRISRTKEPPRSPFKFLTRLEVVPQSVEV